MTSAIMFLPQLENCDPALATFSESVARFFMQTFNREIQISDFITFAGFSNLYFTTNPFVGALILCTFVSATCYIVSEINKNYSQVDRIWSIAPFMYTLHFFVFSYHYDGLKNTRLAIITGIQLIWSIRLTSNYAVRGGYKSGSEDYRWIHVRKKMAEMQLHWGLFNLVFVNTFQNFLLLWLSSPVYLISLYGNCKELGVIDWIVMGFLVTFILIEAIADHQQNVFHSFKTLVKKDSPSNVLLGYPSYCNTRSLKNGFLSEGLFKYSRHPNFTCEQLFWWLQYGYGAYVSNAPINWTCAGAFVLTTIFINSTILTETISNERYPAYKEYSKHVPKFFPNVSSVRPKQDVF